MIKNRFKKILVPLDGSLNSIRGFNEAISLARQCNSTIIGLHVLPIFPRNLTGTFDTYTRYLAKNAKQFLEKAKTSAARHGIAFNEKVLEGNDTVRLITNYAKTTKSDLMVIGSRGKGDSKAKFPGSVATGILYTSQIPVLVVK